jgi:hypothetical protein
MEYFRSPHYVPRITLSWGMLNLVKIKSKSPRNFHSGERNMSDEIMTIKYR